MPNYKKSLFSNCKRFCIAKYGTELGLNLFLRAEDKLSVLINETGNNNEKYIKWHLHKNMLPVIAVYLILKDHYKDSKLALQATDELMQIIRLKLKRKNMIISNLPSAYNLFKAFSKRVVSKQYPDSGWQIEWITRNTHEVHFDMKTCIYVDVTRKYLCPELCPLFCANDEVVLLGYKPAIIFKRKNTIAGGSDKCDFHFYNSKYYHDIKSD